MNTARFGGLQGVKPEKGRPLAGVGAVFRRHRRGRRVWRDVAGTGILLVCLLAVAAMLQTQWPQSTEYAGSVHGFLLRWLTTCAVGSVCLFLPCAAVLGAGAVPTTVEFEATQTALMTRLTAFDLCAGRLSAALWPLLAAILASGAFWAVAQACRHFMPGGLGALLTAHLVLLCAVGMTGAIGFLSALKRRPGRAWGRGAGAALLTVTLGVTGLFLANPQIRRMDDPTRLIAGALLVNPIAAVATACDLDLLRIPWLYSHTEAHDYPFAYPAPLASAGLFASVGLAAQGLSALRLRRAYR
jgi:hypothetical protein